MEEVVGMLTPYTPTAIVAAAVSWVLTKVWTMVWGDKRATWREERAAEEKSPDPGWFDACQHGMPLVFGGLVGWAMSYGLDLETVYTIGAGLVGGAFSLVIVKRVNKAIRGAAVKAADLQKTTGSFDVLDLEKK